MFLRRKSDPKTEPKELLRVVLTPFERSSVWSCVPSDPASGLADFSQIFIHA
jgi:hypothetical protein